MTALDAVALAREIACRGASLGRPLSVVAETGSTNDDARRAALAGAPHGAAFLADAQRAGRGRGGRAWHSPPGENLYLSVILRPSVPAAAVSPVTLVVGLSVADVVERALLDSAAGGGPRSHADVRLKWPNDVLAGGRKLAGVLVEGQLRGDRVSSLVVGVGLNVGALRFPPELAGRATSLALLGARSVVREALAAELLGALGGGIARFEAGGLAPFLDDLARRDALSGRRVAVGDVSGVAAGIDPGGRLLIRGDDGALRPVVAGEVRVVSG